MNHIIFHNILTPTLTDQTIMSDLRADPGWVWHNQELDVSFTQSYSLKAMPTIYSWNDELRAQGWNAKLYEYHNETTKPRVQLVADPLSSLEQFRSNIMLCSHCANKYNSGLTVTRDDREYRISDEDIADIFDHHHQHRTSIKDRKMTLVDMILNGFADQQVRPKSIFRFPPSSN